MRSVLEAFCFLWMVLIVVIYNVSGVFLFRTRFREKVLMAVKIMFYIQMGMVGLLTISSEAFAEIKDVLFWTSVCLTFSLYTFVLPVGDEGPSDSQLWEESKRFGMPIFIVSAVVMAGFLLV
jgi:hypothetical protein